MSTSSQNNYTYIITGITWQLKQKLTIKSGYCDREAKNILFVLFMLKLNLIVNNKNKIKKNLYCQNKICYSKWKIILISVVRFKEKIDRISRSVTNGTRGRNKVVKARFGSRVTWNKITLKLRTWVDLTHRVRHAWRMYVYSLAAGMRISIRRRYHAPWEIAFRDPGQFRLLLEIRRPAP